MTRERRIAVELLGPPLVAAVIITAVFAVMDRDPTVFVGLPFILVFAYVWAGLPAVAFTVVLELAFAKGLEPRSWRAVAVAAVAGIGCGLLVTLWFSPWSRRDWPGIALLAALGAAAGAIVAFVVRRRS